jgi:hypothetical protein
MIIDNKQQNLHFFVGVYFQNHNYQIQFLLKLYKIRVVQANNL